MKTSNKNTGQPVSHTAGSWELIEKDGKAVPHVYPDRGNFLLKICEVKGNSDEEAMANARLIAAAPDLLAACEDVLPLIQDLANGGIACNVQLVKIKAAIAKAKGE